MTDRFIAAFAFLVIPVPLLAQESSPGTLDELLLFFPTKYPEGNWTPANLRFEDVFFDSEDGTKLHGWYCPCESPRAHVLIAHGNAGHIASRADWLVYLQSKANVSVFMFDYRGYGRSQGRPSVKGVLQDAKAARSKLCDLANIKNTEVILMGESLGGAVVTHLAVDSPPAGLILQSTFSSLRDVADIHYPKLSWLVPKSKLNSRKIIADYKGPLLQSHGNADTLIPITMAQDLYHAANDPKSFVTINGRGHNNWLTDSYLRQLDDFIQGLQKKSQNEP